MLPDETVGSLVTDLVHAGHTLYRVQTVRRTLEQAFLALTEPAAPLPAEPRPARPSTPAPAGPWSSAGRTSAEDAPQAVAR